MEDEASPEADELDVCLLREDPNSDKRDSSNWLVSLISLDNETWKANKGLMSKILMEKRISNGIPCIYLSAY